MFWLLLIPADLEENIRKFSQQNLQSAFPEVEKGCNLNSMHL